MEIEQNFQYLIKHLLDPEFDWSNFDEETLSGIGIEVVNNKKNSQQLIGRLAIAQEKLPKRSSMKAFAKAIQVSFSSLRAYKSVEERLVGLDIPEDINWGGRAIIARQSNPKEFLEHVKKEGLSSAMIVKLFSENRDIEEVVCPKCGNVIK